MPAHRNRMGSVSSAFSANLPDRTLLRRRCRAGARAHRDRMGTVSSTFPANLPYRTLPRPEALPGGRGWHTATEWAWSAPHSWQTYPTVPCPDPTLSRIGTPAHRDRMGSVSSTFSANVREES
jgi:hypothetical protein